MAAALAAYQQAILSSGAKNIKGLVSELIDSAEPGPVHVKVWATGQEGEPKYFEAFWAALQLWKFVKSYNPAPSFSPEPALRGQSESREAIHSFPCALAEEKNPVAGVT